MLCNPFIRMAVLSCIALSAACGGDTSQGDVSGSTEVNLVISDPATAPEQLLLLIDFVSYRITCPDSGLTPSYDDSIDASGNLEVDPDADADAPVWELFTDLPLSECTISLWVFYEDEVICSGSRVLEIYEDGNLLTPNKADVVLECNLSVNPPSGDADIDGSFDFVHGNWCPQVFWLGSYPSPDPLVLNIQTRSKDVDNGCGQNCDPQTCDFTTNPPTCSHATDLHMITSMLSAPAGNGTFGDSLALDTTYACDPLLPGPTEICDLVTDGDNDCDRMRCMTIVCPDLCEGGCASDDNECTRDYCDPLTGLCSYDEAPDGIACSNCGSTCLGGACQDDPAVPFTADFVADDSTVFIASDVMSSYSATFVNPYSGASMSVMGDFRVNNSTYMGIGTTDLDMSGDITDVLSGITTGGTQSEILLIQDLDHPQTVCGIETITALNGFDVMFLADDYITLQGMVIEGGNDMDRVWANAGNDTVRGNNGPDLLDGGRGDDIIDGGLGNDTITLWPGSGFDSISGGLGTVDRVEIDAIQSQILITPNLGGYEFDIFYLGMPMAQIMEVELLVMNDASIDLATCTGPDGDVCNLCGDDALNGGEGCDDGNNVDGDGCAADCTSEY
jgi:cysteine-rich repeat protein